MGIKIYVLVIVVTFKVSHIRQSWLDVNIKSFSDCYHDIHSMHVVLLYILTCDTQIKYILID